MASVVDILPPTDYDHETSEDLRAREEEAQRQDQRDRIIVWSAENAVEAFKDEGVTPDELADASLAKKTIGLRSEDGTVIFESTAATAYYGVRTQEVQDLAIAKVSFHDRSSRQPLRSHSRVERSPMPRHSRDSADH